MLAKIRSATVIGLDATPIEVEVDVAPKGLPSLTIVGLPDKGVQEARERVRAALQNTNIEFPAKRVIINLAPADLQKQGAAFDLPMAIGLLIANEDISVEISSMLFIGELSLDGGLRPVTGILPIVLLAKKLGSSAVFVPAENAAEAALVNDITIYPVKSLTQLIAHLTALNLIEAQPHTDISSLLEEQPVDIDMADICDQQLAKRCFEIVAAGGHNVYLYGSPGAGKTMMARALAGILPKLTVQEALEITKIYSVSGNLPQGQSIIRHRPFRNPHHTTSKIGLIGGGSHPKPGEISLAHRGVLFLDEFPEFPRSVIESLRQPMEDGNVMIARIAQTITYPSRFILVSAANPCPCGHLGSPNNTCVCSPHQIIEYKKKISGPILDRIDIHLEVPPVEITKLIKHKTGDGESSAVVRERVQKARNIQSERFKETKLSCNADMSTKDIQRFCPLAESEKSFLMQATITLRLSARSYYKIIKVARTIADLAQESEITIAHLAEALHYRPKEVN